MIYIFFLILSFHPLGGGERQNHISEFVWEKKSKYLQPKTQDLQKLINNEMTDRK